MPDLPTPTLDGADDWVAQHLGHLVCDPGVPARPARRGGQRAADAALAALDVTGYAKRRSQVHPPRARGATVLSPYIRHGLITLDEAIDAASDAPAADRRRFVDEVWWQEYCRHLYARTGTANREPLRREPSIAPTPWASPMPDDMACLRAVAAELEETGWLVNQTRMWVASQWTVRAGHDWREGEDWMFRHLLDGSRAANRYGWQWSIGSMTHEAYGFSQWQVRRRAAAWCATCPRAQDCPIEDWPTTAAGAPLDHELLRSGPDLAGPEAAHVAGRPEAVWLTAESVGDRDPALVAWPDLPAVFVFDEPLLARVRLSAKRLVFLAETLADLAERRTVRIVLGDPVAELAALPLASTFAPVPGYASRAERLDVVVTHPFPWLRRPDGGDVRSHSAWIRRVRRRDAR